MDIKKKKILITGAGGFIGSHLVERLLEENCEIRAFVYYNAFNSWGWLDTFHKNQLDQIEVFAGDIRDLQRVRQSVKGMDIVFHLAALIGIPYSYHAPESYVDTNIKGTLNILQASLDAQAGRVLVTSTSEIYGTAQYAPVDENHPKQGQSPYSASKTGADLIAESFYRSFDLPVTTVRPFNTYGPRQSARAIVPTVITQLLSGKKAIKLGALYPTRDLVFVKDVVEGFLRAAKSDKTVGEEINIATQSEISMGDLAQKLIDMINPQATISKDDIRMRPQKSELERLVGSNEKMAQLTGWRPQYNLDQGLKKTIEWFENKENLKLYKSDIYNV